MQFAEIVDWSNAAYIESSVAGELLDTGWKVGQQGDKRRR